MGVLAGAGQCPAMVEPQGDKQTGYEIEHQAPGIADATGEHLQYTCQAYQQARRENGGYAIERGTDAHKIGLLVLLQS